MHKLLTLYRKHSLIRWAWWLAVVIPGVPFVIISVGLIVYMHWPRGYQEVINFTLQDKTQYLTLSAHGVKDTPSSWSDHLQETMSKVTLPQLNGLQQEHISLSWQPYSNNPLTCSVAGKKIGAKLGKTINKLPNILAVHLIGHSCGAFVIYGLCQELKSINKSIHIQTTYLDPVSIYSGIFWQYGINNFGSCADFSDSYIDTEDTVPGSNQVIKNSFTFDVTEIRKEKKYTYAPHNWPPHFYVGAYKKKIIPIYFNSSENLQNKFQSNTLIKLTMESDAKF